MIQPALAISEVVFGYDGQRADPFLSIDRLELAAGTIAVLIGANGSGKTTLLKLICGLLQPLSGTITGRGVLVHQRPYLFAESVLANVAWPLRIRGVDRRTARARARVALAEVGLGAVERRWAPRLSGGEKQRVAIARAMVLEPALLVLDEPTSNIDPASVRVIEALIRRVAAGGTAVVLSTHDLAVAYRLADRVVPMVDGQVVPLPVNVLRGETLPLGDEYIGRFQVEGGPLLYCPATGREARTAVVRMDDIILSVEPIATSAQNRFFGTVMAVEAQSHEVVRVGVAVATSRARADDAASSLTSATPTVQLSALITHRSIDELHVAPGVAIYLTFKASAVELY